MKYDPISRRMFLSGMGKTIMSIPLLPSLLGSEARAQICSPPPIRFVSMGHHWTPRPEEYLGNLTADTRIAPDVAVRSLAGMSNISTIIHSGFNSVLPKMSILRGIDCYGPEQVTPHNTTFGLAGVPNTWGEDKAYTTSPIVPGLSSLDVILKKSSRVYPNAFSTGRKLISLTPMQTWQTGWGGEANGSWENSQLYATLVKTSDLYNLFMSDLTGGTVTATPAPTAKSSEGDILNSIYSDYVNTRNSPQLSTEDKNRLSNFMDLIADIQRGVISTPTTSPGLIRTCNPVTFDESKESANHDLKFENQINILVAAMACDLTRVINLGMNMLDGYGSEFAGNGIPDFHIMHHKLSNDPAAAVGNTAMFNAYNKLYIRIGNQVSLLLRKMDSIQEGSGTLLDNSIVYWWNMFGFPRPGSQSSHEDVDLGIVVAGGGAGALQMGSFIDYRHQTERINNPRNGRNNGRAPGFPINQLLVTFLNTYGLDPSEYERPGKAGFGVYENEAGSAPLNTPYGLSAAMKSKLLSDAGKRASLPFLFKRKIC
ncbi:MAG: DUF1552 domain-containing protein [Pseudobdellovibrionaceae bacterium]